MPKSDWYRTKYLKSEHWQTLRVAKLASVDACCYCCGKRNLDNDVHHLHYRKLWDVTLDDLLVLCRRCHDGTHAILDGIKSKDREKVKSGAQALPRGGGRIFSLLRKTTFRKSHDPEPARLTREELSSRVRKRLSLGFKNPATKDFFIALRRVFFFKDVAERYLRSDKQGPLTSRRPCSPCRTSQSPAESAPGPLPRDSCPPIG